MDKEEFIEKLNEIKNNSEEDYMIILNTIEKIREIES